MNVAREEVNRFLGNRHRVLVDAPHPQSLAARVLLRAELRCLAVSTWLNFRLDWLTRQRETHGTLRCHYCGAEDLVTTLPDGAPKRALRQLATVDHVNPRANGGSEFDEANLVVACQPCNAQKGDSTALAHLGT